jgi:hypothetical protein
VPSKGQRAIYVHEIFFSLNIGLAVAIVSRVYVSAFRPGRNGFADSALGMVAWINGAFHLHPQSPVGLELTFLTWIFCCALIPILLLRVIQNQHTRRAILTAGGGAAALVAVPGCILFGFIALRAGSVTWTEHFVDDEKTLLIVEAVAALASLGVYLRGKWPVPEWGTGVLLALHYLLWGWIIFQSFSPVFWGILLATVPCSAGFAWALYTKRLREGPAEEGK